MKIEITTTDTRKITLTIQPGKKKSPAPRKNTEQSNLVSNKIIITNK